MSPAQVVLPEYSVLDMGDAYFTAFMDRATVWVEVEQQMFTMEGGERGTAYVAFKGKRTFGKQVEFTLPLEVSITGVDVTSEETALIRSTMTTMLQVLKEGV